MVSVFYEPFHRGSKTVGPYCTVEDRELVKDAASHKNVTAKVMSKLHVS